MELARNRSPDSIKAEELFHSGMSLAEIAKKIDRPEGTVRRWKSTQNWEKESERSERKANVRKNEKNRQVAAVEPEIEQVSENTELTDKQKAFCIYYIRSFNATKAYQKAYQCSYESAAVNSSRLLKNDKVKKEIEKLRQGKLNREMLREEDIFQRYMDIAFADITDFVEFGRETVPVMGAFGPIKVENEQTGKEEVLTKEVNTVRFRESYDVDGTLIAEVKQGRDGASIKLHDRLKALDWLSEHMNMATEEQKARIDALRAKAKDTKETPVNVTFRKASENHERRQ